MGKAYKSAMGRQIDIDHIRLANDKTIAVGNMKVNAGGDELGRGGVIVKTRDQIMREYYALNSPVAVDPPMTQPQQPRQNRPVADQPAPVTQVQPPAPQPAPIIADPVESLVFIDPNSGLDEIDEGPATMPEPAVMAPVVFTPTPVVIAPPVVAQPVIEPFVPKEIPVGTPAPERQPTIVQITAPKQSMPPQPPEGDQIRGTLAAKVADATIITQTPKLPPNKANGVQRF